MSQSPPPSIIPYVSSYIYPPSSSYDHSFPPYPPATTSFPQPVLGSYNRYGESQVNHVYQPVVRQPQPPISQPPVPAPPAPPATSGKIQRVGLASIQEEGQGGQSRYQQYLSVGGERKYKYNVFSVMDEPWNRCLEGRACGGLPENECVARETFKREWQ